ncbi:MAG TPA: 50S ribosomal protein L11 methyltransferase [Gammaproteobacteria bacterium]|nr:50S ribosomal protein L11 methyltransferase [Gammaproteobacteria bacterium]
MFQISLYAPNPDTASLYELTLETCGALSVTLSDAADQPLLEPGPGETPIWQQVVVTGLFDDNANAEQISSDIFNMLGSDAAEPQLKTETIADRDWVRAWMDDFKPMRFGTRLWICPSVYQPPEPDAVNIMLDPGLAFGTGTHPTTALCLRWLDAHPPANKQVIDYGCGSGVLAIAALLLKADQVTAVDNDPQALQASHDNAQRNQVTDRLLVCSPTEVGKESKHKVDLLIANILAGPLQELAPVLARLLKPGASLVLSGVLLEQAESVKQAYANTVDWLTMTEEQGWICLEGRRKVN